MYFGGIDGANLMLQNNYAALTRSTFNIYIFVLAGTEMNSEAKAVTEGTNNLTSIIPTTSTTTTTSPTTTTPSVAGGKQTTENQTVTTKPPIPESKSKNSSTVAPTQNTKPQKVSSNNKTGSLTSPVVSESYQTVTTTVLTPAIASGQNVTSSVTWTDKAAGSSSAHVRNMSSSSATVTYNTRTSQKSVSPPSTLSTLPATEIHIRLHQTSRPPSSNVTKVRDHLYHSSLTDDEDYAPASGDGDDDITIDDVTDERGHGGHHRDKDRHRDGNGGHHGGHHHKKGHHHGNGVTQEVPYHYVQGGDRVRERLRHCIIRLLVYCYRQHSLCCYSLLSQLILL